MHLGCLTWYTEEKKENNNPGEGEVDSESGVETRRFSPVPSATPS